MSETHHSKNIMLTLVSACATWTPTILLVFEIIQFLIVRCYVLAGCRWRFSGKSIWNWSKVSTHRWWCHKFVITEECVTGFLERNTRWWALWVSKTVFLIIAGSYLFESSDLAFFVASLTESNICTPDNESPLSVLNCLEKIALY